MAPSPSFTTLNINLGAKGSAVEEINMIPEEQHNTDVFASKVKQIAELEEQLTSLKEVDGVFGRLGPIAVFTSEEPEDDFALQVTNIGKYYEQQEEL